MASTSEERWPDNQPSTPITPKVAAKRREIESRLARREFAAAFLPTTFHTLPA
jgi:hypothetical protein